MSSVALTGRIAVPGEVVEEAKQAMTLALLSVVEKFPGAEFKEVYSRTERWGRRRDHGAEFDGALHAVLDNNTIREPVELPDDLAGDL